MINFLSCPITHVSKELLRIINLYYLEKGEAIPPCSNNMDLCIPDSYFKKYDADYLKNEYYEVKKKYDEWVKPIKEYLKKHPMTEI